MLIKLLIVHIVVLFTSMAHANQPPCEIWNYDTEQCESFADQNITVNQNWAEFY